MKKSVKAILVLAVALIGIISFQFLTDATEYPFDNLFAEGFAGYTTHEKQVETPKSVSSKNISVKEGETVWFGPCEETQYFHLVGFDANGKSVTGQVRSKDLTLVTELYNGLVIYSYKVPKGVSQLCFTVKSTLADVYAISKTEITGPSWLEYWNLKGVNVEDYIGTISYYKVATGEKVYFGAVTKETALGTILYSETSNLGTVSEADLRFVKSFGAEFGIYCYTVPENVKYVEIPYDSNYEQYYTMIKKAKEDTTSDTAIVDEFISAFGIPKPKTATVNALSGKSALFVGDSITYGYSDHAKIYEYGGWAGRIGYYCNMDVLNNGVPGACIANVREASQGAKYYIYNNLVAAKNQDFDYVIMHGLFNDAANPVTVGTPQGKANFDPAKANVSQFAGGLEMLFYTAGTQHPDAILGFIVNFHTDRAIDQTPYVNMAIQICEDWGVDYLDLYNDATFTVEFDDGLHPNSAGYDSMYNKVADWMATLK